MWPWVPLHRSERPRRRSAGLYIGADGARGAFATHPFPANTMSMQRVSARAVRGARGFHCTPAASASISFNSVISKVTNDADKARLVSLQKVHDTAKGAMMGVKDSAESIDFAEWSAKIGDTATVSEIKAAFEAVTLPSASETTMVDHPAWDQAEFAKLSASLALQNEETSADLKKLKAYSAYLKSMPAVSEMTVEDVLGKNSALDYQVQRQMDEIEVRAFPPPPPLPICSVCPGLRALEITGCGFARRSAGSCVLRRWGGAGALGSSIEGEPLPGAGECEERYHFVRALTMLLLLLRAFVAV